MYPPWRSPRGEGESSEDVDEEKNDDTFHQVYVPLLKIALKISTIKYTVLLIYSIHQMQQHLSRPSYCSSTNGGHAHICTTSQCIWLQNLVPNLPNFLIFEWFFVEQCAYLLVAFFASCSLFLYAIWRILRRKMAWKRRFRVVLVAPSMGFELLLSFLLYNSTIISIHDYAKSAEAMPNFHSSAFIIFALICSIFYACSLVLHFATVYYIMISPLVVPRTTFATVSNYAPSNANYSQLDYGQFIQGSTIRSQGGRSQHYYETLQAPPLLQDSSSSSYHRLSSVINNYQQSANDTRSVYSQVRSWNNTLRSTTNTIRTQPPQQQRVLRDDENDYLELI